MGGLIRKMPVTSTTCAIASLSISGVPPFNGFWSKLIIIFAFMKAGYTIYGVLAIVVAFMTMISFIRLQMNVLFGELPERFEKIKEVPFMMTLPLVILAILCLAVGIAYPFIDSVMLKAARDTLLDQAAFLSFIAGV